MAARSISSLTVTFGLVAIPVKLYTATSSKAVSFNLLHNLRLAPQAAVPLRQGGRRGSRADMVKGYEFAKDQYVMFTPDELKALEEAGSHAVEITEFVPIESVDPIFFDKAYYLAPDKGGAKPYALFAQALRESDRCALGRWASHGKQHVVMLRPFENGLVLQQLLYAATCGRSTNSKFPRSR
jgi:DNA end-binding protein Ku